MHPYISYYTEQFGISRPTGGYNRTVQPKRSWAAGQKVKRVMKNNILVKIILVVILSLLGLGYLVMFVGSVYEAIVFPQAPEKVTLEQAIELDATNKPTFLFFEKSLYVIITDAKWECASVKQVDARGTKKDHTDGVFTNASRSAVVFVQLQGLYSCQELQQKEVAGELQHFTRRPVEYQSDENGLITIDDKSEISTLSLCTHCTPFEASFYPVVFFLFPFIMWAIFKYGNRQQQKKVE